MKWNSKTHISLSSRGQCCLWFWFSAVFALQTCKNDFVFPTFVPTPSVGFHRNDSHVGGKRKILYLIYVVSSFGQLGGQINLEHPLKKQTQVGVIKWLQTVFPLLNLLFNMLQKKSENTLNPHFQQAILHSNEKKGISHKIKVLYFLIIKWWKNTFQLYKLTTN